MLFEALLLKSLKLVEIAEMTKSKHRSTQASSVAASGSSTASFSKDQLTTMLNQLGEALIAAIISNDIATVDSILKQNKELQPYLLEYKYKVCSVII